VEENIREEKMAQWRANSARSDKKYWQIVVLGSYKIENKKGIRLFLKSLMVVLELGQFMITTERIWQTGLREKRLIHSSSGGELTILVEKEQGVWGNGVWKLVS
jgi:hypothetical protein